MSGAELRQRIAAAWQARPAREQRLIALAAGLVALAFVWWLALAPALATLRAAPAQRAQLQAQAEQVQQWQRQAQALQSQPRLERATALAALESATARRLGTHAQLSVAGERAQLTLKDVPAPDLAAWLAEVRGNARALPVEARLTRSGAAGPGAPVLWSGTLALALSP